jgi:DNA-binding response OmpR family regulator
MSKRILLVEDDPSLGFVVKDGLAMKGFDVVLCADGEKGQEAFDLESFDVCILDVMLPKRDGFTLAQDIRRKNSVIPILFITAKGMLEDKIAGFTAGGDDYLVKPFSMEELFLRIDVFLRRTSTGDAADILQIGAYSFDARNLTLHHPSGDKVLTQKESEVLELLCRNKDRILKREEILKKVWGDDDYFLGRSLDVFISKLRKYLKEDPTLEIVNYHAVGFRLEAK